MLDDDPQRATARGVEVAMVVEPTPAVLQPFVAQEVVLLQTRKRDGTWVDTPVNIAVHGARAYFRTPALAAKNKRLRNSADVRFSPCTWRGRSTGPAVHATARRLAGEEDAAAGQLIDRKYPLLQRVLVRAIHRLLRTETLHDELTVPQGAGSARQDSAGG